MDITFLNANNEEIQPEGAVSVSMVPYTPLETTETSTIEVIHKDDSGNTQVIDAAASAQNATFDADSFSIYVISTKDGKQDPAIATYNFYGADNQTVISTQMVKDGETVYAPTTPEKAGSKFIGWSSKKDATELQAGDPGNFTQITASVSTTDDVKLYPVFQQAYYVFFLDNQGRVSTTKEGVSGNVISTKDVAIPLDSTHSVTGWYTEAELTNKVEAVTLSKQNVTLYPKVEEGHYLYFSSGDGASYVKPVFVAAEKGTAAPDDPTRPGYTFLHWSEREEGSAYTFGSSISEDTTLYGVWEAKTDTTYTVIFWKQSVLDKKNAADNAKTYDYAESVSRTGTT
ncbi:MAG: InlB B-repeat-containing protein, partial [Lachnospiraceae bacterium]|nr:InlB B-repeat-containing protein [Lachnospiraceae bacterium]